MEDRHVRIRTIKPTTRGRITIPAEFRRELGREDGSLVEITLKNGGFTIRPFTAPEENVSESSTNESV